MKLLDIINEIEGELISDGTFERLEYCTAKCEEKILTFIENEKYIDKIGKNVNCIITMNSLYKKLPSNIEGVIISEEPKKTFVLLHNLLSKKEEYVGKKFNSIIGKNCEISPLAYIAKKNVIIGDNVKIGAFVAIRENVTIGNNCKIYENTVIGGQSFNFVKTKEGKNIGMVDCGRVVIEDFVEICSSCHVASGPLPTDVTRIENEVKLDALVHVGHGSRVGARTLIPAGVQISGNVDIGSDAWIGVNATIANRITIGDRGRISLGSVVTKNVGVNQTVSGNFAIPHDMFINNLKESIR